MNTNSIVVYQGPSEYTGAPVLLFLSGLKRPSQNSKTGPLVASYILGERDHPVAAVHNNADRHVCGGCPLRGGGACYVLVGFAPAQLWRAWHAGRIALVEPSRAAELLRGRKLRLGSYGDPAAIPRTVWETLLPSTTGFAGYTHAWRGSRFRWLQQYCMASVETDRDRELAAAQGWSTFQVRPKGDATKARDQQRCPASTEMGHRTTCDRCGKCNGATTKQRHIVIQAHGAKALNLTRKRVIR